MALSSPAADRNKLPIWEVLNKILPRPPDGRTVRLLEVSSGSGQHAAFFASSRSDLFVQPTDQTLENAQSVQAHATQEGVTERVMPLQVLDLLKGVEDELAKGELYDAAVCINMLHIAPHGCAEGLFKACDTLLEPGGFLLTYGPYRIDGWLSDSNKQFEEEFIKRHDKNYGIWEIRDLEQVAKSKGFYLEWSAAMPSNNMVLLWRRDPRLKR